MGAKKSKNPDKKIKTEPGNYKYISAYPNKLIKMGMEGKSIPDFCVAADICEPTYWRWVRTIPEFKKAHFKYKTFAKKYWMEFGAKNVVTYVGEKGEGEKFDTSLYKFITGGRFGMSNNPDIELLQLGVGSLQKQQRDAMKALANGHITMQQASAISSMLKEAIDIDTHVELKSKIEELERVIKDLKKQPTITKQAEEPEYDEV